MTQATRRVNVERDPDPEEQTKEGVVNDSLGTVHPSDSTGLDDSKPGDQDGAHSSED